MKYIKLLLKTILLLFVILNVYILVSGKTYVYKADDAFSIGNYAYLFDNDYENTLTREVWKLKFSAFIMNELKPIPSNMSVLIVQFIFGTDYCFHPEKFDYLLCQIHHEVK